MSSGYSTRILAFPARGRASRALREHARAAIAGDGAVPLARLRVRAHGQANRHALGTWREDPDRPGVEMIACIRCGAGASLNREAAIESISAALLEACKS